MTSIIFPLVMGALLMAFLFTFFAALELRVNGESVLLRSFGSLSRLQWRYLILGPLVAPSRASTVFTLGLVGVAFLAGSLAAGIPFVAVTGPRLSVVSQWVAPALTAVILSYALIVVSEERGLLPLDTVMRRLAWVAGAVFLVNIVVAALAQFPILATLTAVGYAAPVYLGAHALKTRQKYRARVVWDRGFVRYDSRYVGMLWRIAQRGWVLISYPLAKLTLRESDTKDVLKLKTVLAYHMHYYEESLATARHGLSLGITSEILVTYEALASARLGDVFNATRRLCLGLQGNPRNAYFRSTLAYLHWTQGELGDALREADRALRDFESDHGRPCYQTSVHRGLFRLDVALRGAAESARMVDANAAAASLADSLAAYREARAGNDARWGEGLGGLVHNLGLACVLLAGHLPEATRDEALRFGLTCFARSVWLESHAASRLRVALFHMVASRRFESAEFQLRRLLWSHQNQTARLDAYFGQLITTNLRRVEMARRQGVRFSAMIFHLHTSSDLIPEAAILSDRDAGAEIERKKQWFRFGLHDVIGQPFLHMPAAVREAMGVSSVEGQDLGEHEAPVAP